MKCRRHPSMEQLKHKPGQCALCERGDGVLEHDLAADRYEQMAQHVEPGIRGIRTRRQYHRLLKSRGLTDDISTKELIACNRNQAKREQLREEHVRKVTHRLMERAQSVIAQSPVNPIPRTPQERALLEQVRRVYR